MRAITKETIQFFRDIKENNNKPWFEKNKSRYETMRENIIAFVEDLIPEIKKIEPIVEKEAKKYPFRIYRDVRFSPDKSPYKNNVGFLIERAPDYKKCPFYVHIQPDEYFAGGGVWQPEPPLLKKIRQEIDYTGSNLHKIISKKSFTDFFTLSEESKLIRPPKGYDEENPHIELLKLKNYVVFHHFTEEMVTSTDFGRELVKTYKHSLEFLKYFDQVTQELSESAS